ncbi:head GIN domain-containing protein [Chitinophaga vietnamensis]|uniref:head GIN domain-containing protein n=1 Tax=Chitinophaga vietnamensis TaxID=2593957 RepID=UPI0011784C16|nr:head GIN domain-containing protein [Chitinophaga vietnamensis]
MKILRKQLLIALPFVLAAFLLSSFIRYSEITGNGVVKQEERKASPFKKISTSGPYKVVIRQGNDHTIKVEAEENLLPYIVTEISGSKLEIYTKKGEHIRTTKPVTVYVTMKEVSGLESSGASGFRSEGQLRTDHLSLGTSGASECNLNIDADEVSVGTSGASKIHLQGRANDASYGTSGASDIDAVDLQSQDVKIGISGSGNAKVNAVKTLSVTVSGNGNVQYKGCPAIQQSVSGRGNISKL